MAETEILRVIHLNRQRGVLGIAQYPGEPTRVILPLRRIIAEALRLESAALLLSHNHPSGDPTPSRADIDATHQLAALLKALDVRLHDHIVTGGRTSVSFREMGLL